MTQHVIEIDHEYEIFNFADHFGERVRNVLGSVFAKDQKEAVRTAREQFGRGLGRIKAKEID